MPDYETLMKLRNTLGTPKLLRAGIKSVHMTSRDIGYETETNDCAVKALQAVTGVPYRDAHSFAEKTFGRKFRRGTQRWELELNRIAQNKTYIYGFRVFAYDARVGKTWGRRHGQLIEKTAYQTLSQFLVRHPHGRFLLASNSHAFAVIDGVVYDNGAAGGKTKITSIFELKESSKVEREEYEKASRESQSGFLVAK